MEEVILLESTTLRNRFCTERNTEVLERFGNLVLLPNTGFATTEMLADFYQVSINTIRQITLRHKDEFEMDEYTVMPWNDFVDKFCVPVKSKGRMIALYPRKAILRVGMLLRDSEVAKLVRTYLVNLEQSVMQTVNKGETALSIMAQQLSSNAEELASQAKVLCAVVHEMERNRNSIKEFSCRLKDHENRIYSLEKQSKSQSETISLEQVKILRNMVKAKVQKPVSFWSKFNAHFQISRYSHLAKARFEDACHWIEQNMS